MATEQEFVQLLELGMTPQEAVMLATLAHLTDNGVLYAARMYQLQMSRLKEFSLWEDIKRNGG